MENGKIRLPLIKGVELFPLTVVPVAAGDVMRLLRPESPALPKFPAGIGEIYFSEILPGKVKAWKMHAKQTQRLAAPFGKIRIALYDMRADSSTLRVLDVLELGRPGDYNMLIIPPGIWFGFRCASETPALLCNCPDMAHDPDECQRAPQDTPDIPYIWDSEK
ncbi:MAG: dTDP-4-dehydrorhamnose 3,5-epimerase [Desulfovibrio sp.]|nr:dTDP-4-dehydrorhamnose 3,5-epimerase [Desulfovibrio sp.]